MSQSGASLLLIAELAQRARESHIFWHNSSEDDQQHYREQLAPWAEIPIWIGTRTAPRGEQRVVFLSEGEKSCAELRFKCPSRDGSAYELSNAAHSRIPWIYQQTTLGELIATQDGIEALHRRLDKNCIAPYNQDELAGFDLSQAQTVWTWENQECYPVALLCVPIPGVPNGPAGEFPLLIPAEWGALSSHWHGSLHLQAAYTLIVCDTQGKYGLVQLHTDKSSRVVGQWLRSCELPYMGAARGGALRILEVATNTEPDPRGELVCDLFCIMRLENVNPRGLKGLMGSIDYDGAIVVNEADCGNFSRVLRRVDHRGVLFKGQETLYGEPDMVPWGVEDLCWLEIGSQHEGMTAVRSAVNGLWGFVDRSGALMIPARYADVGSFNDGLAPAIQPNTEFWGLIDKAGDWVLVPNWITLEVWEKDLIVVEHLSHRWGAVDSRGNTVVELKLFSEWLEMPAVVAELNDYQSVESAWPKDLEKKQRQCVVDEIRRVSKAQFRQKVCASLSGCSGSLAAMEGLFGAHTSERDLREVGLWGQRVRLLADKTEGVLQPKQGEMGRIGCYYPVTLSIFDLSIEAPVNDLPTQPDAAVGIRWQDLALVLPEGAEKQAEPPEALDSIWEKWVGGFGKIKRQATVGKNLFVGLLLYLLIWVELGLVGIGFNAVLDGVHHLPLIPPLVGLLSLGLFVWLSFLLGRLLWAHQRKLADDLLSRTAKLAQRYFLLNLATSIVWLFFATLLKNDLDKWFVAAWSMVASIGVLKMVKTIRDACAPPKQPDFPTEIVEKMKAEFRKAIEADGEDGPCEITCTRSRFAMFQWGFVDDYIARYPELAPFETEIYKILDEMVGLQ